MQHRQMNGFFKPQNFDLAEKWWTIAAKQGNKDAEAALKELAIIRAEMNKF